MVMNNIECLMGNENFPGMQSKTYLFVPNQAAFRNPAGEVPLFAAAKTATHGIQTVRSGNRIPAHQHGIDGAGYFTNASYSLPEGIILKLFAMKKLPGHMQVSSMFLRSRADAALSRFEIELTGHNTASMRRAFVEGRFDVLTLDQAKRAGIMVLPMHQAQFDPARARAVITRRELSTEIRSAPVEQAKTITNADGEQVQVVAGRRRRHLDV